MCYFSPGYRPALITLLVVLSGLCAACQPAAGSPASTDTSYPPTTIEESATLSPVPEITQAAPTDSPTPTGTAAPTATSIPVILPEGDYAGPLPPGAVARFGKGNNNATAMSPDGKYLAVGGSLGMYIYDAASLDLEWFDPTASGVSSIGWSSDSAVLSAGLFDGTVITWDAETGERQRALQQQSDVMLAVAWSPDDKLLATGASAFQTIVWNAQTGEAAYILPAPPNNAQALVWSPAGDRLAIGTGNAVTIWDVATGERLQTLNQTETSDNISETIWSPDGKKIAARQVGGAIIAWDVAAGDLLYSVPGSAVAWSPDGALIVTGDEEGRLSLWDADTGEPIPPPNPVDPETGLPALVGFGSGIRTLDWSPDGTHFISGDADGNIILWDTASGKWIRSFDGHLREIRDLTWLPDGAALISRDWAGTVIRWDVQTGTLVRVLPGHSNEYQVSDIAWSPDGTHILTGSWGGRVLLWDVETGQPQNIIRRQGIGSTRVAWSSNGAIYAIIQANTGQVIYWDHGLNEVLRTDQIDGATVSAWSPDDTVVAVGATDGAITLVQFATGNAPVLLEGHSQPISSLDWSPSGDLLASAGGDGRIVLWNVDAGQVEVVWDGETDRINDVAWSPDGMLLAAASNDGTITLWNTQMGRIVYGLKGHTGSVYQVAWSPDGAALASASADGNAIVWDVTSGNRLRTLTGHTDEVSGLDWSPDGSLLASGSRDGTIILWNVAP